MQILEMYRDLVENQLAIPVLAGTKTDSEKFVGALYTTTLEALMFDGKVLQMGTSHNLGQNFSKPFGIRYVGKDEKEHFAWTASWGVSWRLIGGVIMVHGDDKGLVLPPRIAPIQIVVVPIFYSEEEKTKIVDRIRDLESVIQKAGISITVDDRIQYTPGWKFHEWELKGVPLRLEIGPRDIEKNQVTGVRRDTGEKIPISDRELVEKVKSLLQDIQDSMLQKAKRFLHDHITSVSDYERFSKIVESDGGFVRACWCSDPLCEEKIKEETGATIRVIPFEKEEIFSPCVCCGKKANQVGYFARAY
jgi:prolyl-tRNA synthetase